MGSISGSQGGILKILVYVLAIFFAFGWTFVLWRQPSQRVISTIVTVLYWWMEIVLALLNKFNAFHLLWLMPLSLFLPSMLLLMQMRKTFLVNFILSGVVIIPVLIWLVS